MIAKIAIIDDAVRDSMRALLESYGYEVRDHASAEAFLSHSEKGIGCLLTDHHMPGMTGIDLLERLRATGDQTPALMITGYAGPIMQSRADRIGVTVLQKPVEEEELVRTIEQERSR